MAKTPSPLDLSEARDALDAFVSRDGQEAADRLEKIFADAAGKIATSLTRATSGAQSPFRNIAGSVLGQLGAMAVDGLFNKSQTQPATESRSPMIVNFNVGAGADAESIRRGQSQISAQVARAAQHGQRNS